MGFKVYKCTEEEKVYYACFFYKEVCMIRSCQKSACVPTIVAAWEMFKEAYSIKYFFKSIQI